MGDRDSPGEVATHRCGGRWADRMEDDQTCLYVLFRVIPSFFGCIHLVRILEKKKEIWLRPMTKTPIPTENSKTNGQHKNETKNFDYTTIVDRLTDLQIDLLSIQNFQMSCYELYHIHIAKAKRGSGYIHSTKVLSSHFFICYIFQSNRWKMIILYI